MGDTLLSARVENIVGKGENVLIYDRKKEKHCNLCSGLTLLFPLCFQKQSNVDVLTLSQTSPGFYVSAAQFFGKHCGKRRNCS